MMWSAPTTGSMYLPSRSTVRRARQRQLLTTLTLRTPEPIWADETGRGVHAPQAGYRRVTNLGQAQRKKKTKHACAGSSHARTSPATAGLVCFWAIRIFKLFASAPRL